jgi:hypothetical protein
MARTPIRLSAPNIVDALRDPHGFGGLACFRNLTSWSRWLVFLKAVYGLPLDTDELEIFQHHTGRTAPLPGGYPVAVVIVGRQSGKTRIAGTVAAYEALIAPRVPDGESEFALLVSQDERGALRTLFSYAKAPFTRPLLKGRKDDGAPTTRGRKLRNIRRDWPCIAPRHAHTSDRYRPRT